MKIFGLDYFDQNQLQLKRQLGTAIEQNKKVKLAFCDLNMLGEYLHSPVFARQLSDFDFIMADGSVIILLKNIFFPGQFLKRIPGPDFFSYLIESDQKYSHFFLGSTMDCLEKLAHKVRAINPGFQLKGYYSPPFEKQLTEKTNQQIQAIISQNKPDILWVSLGCPKQEKWIYDQAKFLPAKVVIAIGAAFDFYAGTTQRAPLILRKAGLEFLFRLFIQKRIIKRIIKGSYRVITHIYKIKR